MRANTHIMIQVCIKFHEKIFKDTLSRASRLGFLPCMNLDKVRILVKQPYFQNKTKSFMKLK